MHFSPNSQHLNWDNQIEITDPEKESKLVKVFAIQLYIK